uniref:Uncharacterized protein n=1 Tax=Romanomermis culicivorax TaxID=13658 RepID=A0A915HQ75_ROMCU
VEAALLAEPENPSLLKLKQDLDEIIAITVELLLPSSSINDDEDDLNTPEVSNFTFEDDDSLAKKWR